VPPQLICASALYRYLVKGRNIKIAFSLKYRYCISALWIAWIQPPAWFLQSFWFTTHTHDAVWLPKSCNQCVQLGALGSMVQDKRSRERCRSLTALHAQCTAALSYGFPISQGNAEPLDR